MSSVRDMRRPMVLADDPDREARRAEEEIRREAQQRAIRQQAELKQAQDAFGVAMQDYQLLQGMVGAVRHAGTLATKHESPEMCAEDREFSGSLLEDPDAALGGAVDGSIPDGQEGDPATRTDT